MDDMRDAILKGEFKTFAKEFIRGYEPANETSRMNQRKKQTDRESNQCKTQLNPNKRTRSRDHQVPKKQIQLLVRPGKACNWDTRKGRKTRTRRRKKRHLKRIAPKSTRKIETEEKQQNSKETKTRL